jgi:diguanylate cyclase (GGDEF)-like protein
VFPNLFHSIGHNELPPMPVRSRMLSVATILLVFAVIAASIYGFNHVSSQQEALTSLRQQGAELRDIQQALVQADADVQHVLTGEGAPLPDYFARMQYLNSDAGKLFAALAPITVDGIDAPQPAMQLFATLNAAWDEALQLNTRGDPAGAYRLLSEHHALEAVAALTNRLQLLSTEADASFRLQEERIRYGTLLVLILQLGGGFLAVLGLVYAFRSSVSEADGRAAAVASANASREQVTRLFAMADVLQSAADHIDANAVLTATAADLLPGFPGALYVFNNSRDRLVLSTHWGRAEDQPNGGLSETINPNSCWALKRGKPHLNRADGAKLCCAHHPHEGTTVLEIPMIARGEIVGLLQLFATGDDAEARLGTVTELGTALADGMSLALANMALREKLRNQALRDPLTGLYNRRFMEDSLQRFVRLADREQREISLLMVDLDHFKRLNDEHGHAFGDQVLRETATTLLGALRETDIVCRYGGEEIVVILPDCPLERAADKAEFLRLRIQELSNTHGADISASFGVASLPHTSQSVTDLLSAADAALYRAKQGGRNQVVRAPLRPYRLDREDEGTAEIEEFPRAAAE